MVRATTAMTKMTFQRSFFFISTLLFHEKRLGLTLLIEMSCCYFSFFFGVRIAATEVFVTSIFTLEAILSSILSF